jgi:hypothetical protein
MMMITKVATLCALIAAANADACSAKYSTILTSGTTCSNTCTYAQAYTKCLATECQNGDECKDALDQCNQLDGIWRTQYQPRFSHSSYSSSTCSCDFQCDTINSDCSGAGKALCESLAAVGIGAGLLVVAIVVLCFFPLVVFVIGYCICIQPKANNGQGTPTGCAWCTCCAIFWLVVVALSLVGGIFTWVIGSFLMMIPFCLASCYQAPGGGNTTVIMTQQSQMGMMGQPMMQQPMMQQPMMQQPMMQQPVYAAAPVTQQMPMQQMPGQMPGQQMPGQMQMMQGQMK